MKSQLRLITHKGLNTTIYLRVTQVQMEYREEPKELATLLTQIICVGYMPMAKSACDLNS